MTERIGPLRGNGGALAGIAAVVLALATGCGPARADGLPAVRAERIAGGLTAPLDLADPNDGSGRLFVAEQPGTIRVLAADGTLANTPLLDLRDRMVALREGFEERGLLGLALHPGFARNGRLFVTYSAPLQPGAPSGWNHTRRISEFTLDPERPGEIDPLTERVLLEVHWPSRKHNGGGLAFGPDGHLYIGLGDGGGVHGVGEEVAHDAFEVPRRLHHWDEPAQDPSSLFGSILRLDVDRGLPGYAIPQSNPLRGTQGRAEIYAWGFRNPYRIASIQRAIRAPSSTPSARRSGRRFIWSMRPATTGGRSRKAATASSAPRRSIRRTSARNATPSVIACAIPSSNIRTLPSSGPVSSSTCRAKASEPPTSAVGSTAAR